MAKSARAQRYMVLLPVGPNSLGEETVIDIFGS